MAFQGDTDDHDYDPEPDVDWIAIAMNDLYPVPA